MQKARDAVGQKFPSFSFEGYLMHLDGTVEAI
jgi:hypothetical protein